MFEIRQGVEQHPEAEYQDDESHEYREAVEFEHEIETERGQPTHGLGQRVSRTDSA